MPKLNKATAKKVEESSGSFELIPEGPRHLRLREVDGSKEGPSGPYWVWEFESVEDDEYKNRRLWLNTSLAEQALFGLQGAFAAFGVSTETDTEDLLGQVVLGIVGQRTIQKGERKGELTNEITKLKPKKDNFEVPEDLAASEQPDPDEIFS